MSLTLCLGDPAHVQKPLPKEGGGGGGGGGE